MLDCGEAAALAVPPWLADKLGAALVHRATIAKPGALCCLLQPVPARGIAFARRPVFGNSASLP